jgi:hypothetical protein
LKEWTVAHVSVCIRAGLEIDIRENRPVARILSQPGQCPSALGHLGTKRSLVIGPLRNILVWRSGNPGSLATGLREKSTFANTAIVICDALHRQSFKASKDFIVELHCYNGKLVCPYFIPPREKSLLIEVLKSHAVVRYRLSSRQDNKEGAGLLRLLYIWSSYCVIGILTCKL